MMQKELNKFKTFLQDHVHKTCSKKRNSVLYEELMYRLKTHPSWAEKLDTILRIRITTSKLNKSAIILKIQTLSSPKRWIIISWRRCITKKPVETKKDLKNNNDRSNLLKAFRYAIKRQIKTWKQKEYKKNKQPQCNFCSNVGERKNELQADHKISFVSIVDQYIAFCEKKSIDIPTHYVHTRYCQIKFAPQYKSFTLKWQRYHKRHAKYQWLCKSCNCKKGKEKI